MKVEAATSIHFIQFYMHSGTKATTIFKLRVLRIFGILFCFMLIAAEVLLREATHSFDLAGTKSVACSQTRVRYV